MMWTQVVAPARAVAAAAAASPPGALGDPVKVSLITACVTFLVTVLGIVAKDWLPGRRKERVEAEALFQRYADPLGESATGLLFRMREVLDEPARGAYLRGTTPATPYTEYKRVSTAHRLACLLGWVRAIRREQSFLPAPGSRNARRLRDALATFEAALADGPHVELQRLVQFAELWALPLPDADPERTRVAVILDQAREHAQHGVAMPLSAAPDGIQLAVCGSIAALLCTELRLPPVTDARIGATAARGAEILTSREAWLFRDWQTAIGDLMLRPATGGLRRFDVLGFGDFEEMWAHGTPGCKKWLRRLDALLVDLDVTSAAAADTRVLQLRNVFAAAGTIVLALADARRGAVFSARTLEVAREATGVRRAPSRWHQVRSALARRVAPND